MPTTRRSFFASVAASGIGLFAPDWPGVREALAHARAAQTGAVPVRFAVLTPAEAADMRAIAARIMPTTDTPGATEAGVVFFVDRAFGSFAADGLADFQREVAALGTRAKARRPAATRFAQLPIADQDALLIEMEKTPFFRGLRSLVMIGMFADPKYGGNRGEIGWKLIGFENRMSHSPPFGYYDAQAAGGRD